MTFGYTFDTYSPADHSSNVKSTASNTIDSQFTINMLEGARLAGHNIEEILKKSNISPRILQQPRSRITYKQQSDLALLLIDLLNDEMLGLLNKPVKSNTFKMLAYSMINAKTLGDAIEIWIEGSQIFDIGLKVSVKREDELTQYIIERHTSNQAKNPFVIEQTLFIFHRVLCWLADQRVQIMYVELDYPKPSYSEEYRRLFLNAPIRFNQKRCLLAFNDRSMALSNVRDFTQLKIFLKQMPLTLLSDTFKSKDLSTQIRSWFERLIIKENITPSMVSASQQFDLHPQSLRRRLAKEGTTFTQIKSETQRDIAINLINDNNKSIETVAFELGFSERAPFIRAFKRWTGLTPYSYRKLSSYKH